MERFLKLLFAGLLLFGLAGSVLAAETGPEAQTVSYHIDRIDGIGHDIMLPKDNTKPDKFSPGDLKVLGDMAKFLTRQYDQAEKDKSQLYYWLVPSPLPVVDKTRLTAYGLAEASLYAKARFKTVLDKALEWYVVPGIAYADGQEPLLPSTFEYYSESQLGKRLAAREVWFCGFGFMANAKADRATYLYLRARSGKAKLLAITNASVPSAKELKEAMEGPLAAFVHIFSDKDMKTVADASLAALVGAAEPGEAAKKAADRVGTADKAEK